MLAKDALIIDMSSSVPVDTQSLGKTLAERGIGLVDAPVSGGVRRAIDGTLAIMAGGDAALVERARPVLQAMAKSVFATGPLGSGHAMKALNNYVSAAGLVAACEALLVGRRFGLQPDTIIDVLNASTGKNNSTDVKMKQFVISESFASGFSLALMAKIFASLRTCRNLLDWTHPTPKPSPRSGSRRRERSTRTQIIRRSIATSPRRLKTKGGLR